MMKTLVISRAHRGTELLPWYFEHYRAHGIGDFVLVGTTGELPTVQPVGLSVGLANIAHIYAGDPRAHAEAARRVVRRMANSYSWIIVADIPEFIHTKDNSRIADVLKHSTENQLGCDPYRMARGLSTPVLDPGRLLVEQLHWAYPSAQERRARIVRSNTAYSRTYKVAPFMLLDMTDVLEEPTRLITQLAKTLTLKTPT